MKIHTGVKEHVCEICNARFNRRWSWSRHKRIHWH